MPAPDEAQQLARIAAVTDDLDRLLDDLFATVADLKTILAPQPGAAERAKEAPGE